MGCSLVLRWPVPNRFRRCNCSIVEGGWHFGKRTARLKAGIVKKLVKKVKMVKMVKMAKMVKMVKMVLKTPKPVKIIEKPEKLYQTLSNPRYTPGSTFYRQYLDRSRIELYRFLALSILRCTCPLSFLGNKLETHCFQLLGSSLLDHQRMRTYWYDGWCSLYGR